MSALVHQRPQALDDATLIRRVRAGDERALSQLYLRHARLVAGVVYRILGSDSELDDIVRDVFVEASERLTSLPYPPSFRRWLLAIAVRRVQAHLKRTRGWPGWLSRRRSAPPGRPVKIVRPSSDSVRRCYHELDRLPSKVRVAWVLNACEGEPVSEIARICGTSPEKVRKRIAHAAAWLERLDR